MGDVLKFEKMGEQKRISLDCPKCKYYGLMNIKAKAFVKKQINYYVCCPNCRHKFTQIGRRFNLWRYLKKKHKLKHEKLRTMQKELLESYFEPEGFKDDDEEKDEAKKGQENDGQKEVTAAGCA